MTHQVKPFWLIVVIACLILPAQAQNQPPETFTNLAEIRALSPQAGTNLTPFKLQGVVTYSDPGWKVLYIQDGPAAAFVNHENSADDPGYKLVPGQVVEMEGKTAPGLAHCNIADQHVRVLSEAPLPDALDLSKPAILDESAEGRLVHLTGWVVNQSPLGTRTVVGVAVAPGKFVTLVLQGMDEARAVSLPGTQIEATGVLALKLNSARQKTGEYLLFNNSIKSLRKLAELPVFSPADLTNQPALLSVDEPLRVHGRLSRRISDGALIIQGETNAASVCISCQWRPDMSTETSVEAIGFPVKQNDELILTNTVLRAIKQGLFPQVPSPVYLDNGPHEINQIIRVRQLSAESAAKAYPVKVIGVLTFFEPGNYSQYIQDATAGIYMDISSMAASTNVLEAGQTVEVTGSSGAGDYAPIINASSIRVLDQQSPFPPPRPANVGMLMTGTEDSQWIGLQGVVRQQTLEANGTTTLVIHDGEALMKIRLPATESQVLPTDFVDSVVEVRGVCRTIFNDQRELTDVEMYVPNWAQIQVTEPAPLNPFDLPATPVKELFQFHAERSGLHRQHVQGRSLLRLADGSFYLQDKSGGVRVQPLAAATIGVGREVGVVGFPALVNGLPVLQDSLIKDLGVAKAVAPLNLMPNTVLDQTNHGTLVQLKGQIIGHSTRDKSELLTVEFGSSIIEAILDESPHETLLDNIVPGSTAQLTGTFVARLDENHKLQSFQVLLSSADAVKILSQPSWWSVRHTAWLLGGLAGVLFLSFAWITLLGNQVKQRTRELSEEIAERRRVEGTLRESEARFHSIFQSSPVAISLSHLSDGRFVDVNESFLKMFGFTRSEVIGHTSSELNLWLAREDRDRLIKQVLEGKELPQVETKFRWKSGEISDALFSGSLLQLHDQTYLLAMVVDITERKKLEHHLRQSQKLESIGHLAGGMAHEFNNLLAAMLLSVQLARTGSETEVARLLEDLEGLCSRAANLIKQLLAFSQRSAIQLRPLDLGSLVARQGKTLRTQLGERITMEISLPTDALLVNADSVLMDQVLLNLCLNARDAMKDGGVIRIAVEEAKVESIQTGTEKNTRLGRYLCLSVADTGCGMDERTLEKLFVPFFTTKGVGQGTGLGLATVRGIVEQHAGWVEVESHPGKGTNFRIYLPILIQTATPPPAIAPKHETVNNGKTILLVEDEPTVRILTRRILKSQGYEVLEAASGDDAVGLWEKHKEQIDLVFTDMVMPGAVSGLTLANQVLADKPGVRVIISSGYNTDLLDPATARNSAIIYLPKPCPSSAMTNLIRECLQPN